MRIIERYALRGAVYGYVMLLLSFFFLYFITDLSFKLQDILQSKVGFKTILRYYLYQSPTIFIQVTPLSALLSVLYTIGVLNRNNEIMAMRVQGVSIYKLSRSFLVFGLFLSFTLLFVQDKIIPYLSKNYSQGLKLEANISYKPEVIKNFAFYSQDNHIVFAREYRPAQNLFSDVNIFKKDDQGDIIEEIISRELVFDHRWILRGALVYKMQNNRLVEESIPFWQEKIFDFKEKPSDIFLRKNTDWQGLSFKDLKHEMIKFSGWKSGNVIRSLVIEIHRRLAQSFSIFFLILGGLPFALRIRQRKVGLSSLGISIIFCLVYYVMFALSLPLGEEGFIFVSWIAPWIANIFFGVSGIVGLMGLR